MSKGARIVLLIIAVGFGALMAQAYKGMTPEPHPTPTVTVVPSPLCTGPTDRQCWETADEQGPPWIWRERAKAR